MLWLILPQRYIFIETYSFYIQSLELMCLRCGHERHLHFKSQVDGLDLSGCRYREYKKGRSDAQTCLCNGWKEE